MWKRTQNIKITWKGSYIFSQLWILSRLPSFFFELITTIVIVVLFSLCHLGSSWIATDSWRSYHEILHGTSHLFSRSLCVSAHVWLIFQDFDFCSWFSWNLSRLFDSFQSFWHPLTIFYALFDLLDFYSFFVTTFLWYETVKKVGELNSKIFFVHSKSKKHPKPHYFPKYLHFPPQSTGISLWSKPHWFSFNQSENQLANFDWI